MQVSKYSPTPSYFSESYGLGIPWCFQLTIASSVQTVNSERHQLEGPNRRLRCNSQEVGVPQKLSKMTQINSEHIKMLSHNTPFCPPRTHKFVQKYELIVVRFKYFPQNDCSGSVSLVSAREPSAASMLGQPPSPHDHPILTVAGKKIAAQKNLAMERRSKKGNLVMIRVDC